MNWYEIGQWVFIALLVGAYYAQSIRIYVLTDRIRSLELDHISPSLMWTDKTEVRK